jgi:hypothetical protein
LCKTLYPGKVGLAVGRHRESPWHSSVGAMDPSAATPSPEGTKPSGSTSVGKGERLLLSALLDAEHHVALHHELNGTRLRPARRHHRPPRHGYLVKADGSLADQTAVHWGIGAEGGMVSNAADTARFLVALMQDRLLGPATLAGMRIGDFWSGGDTPSCGGSAYGHSGAGEGYKTNVWVSSDGSRVVVLLLNGAWPTRPPVTCGPPKPWTSCTAPPNLNSLGGRPRTSASAASDKQRAPCEGRCLESPRAGRVGLRPDDDVGEVDRGCIPAGVS